MSRQNDKSFVRPQSIDIRDSKGPNPESHGFDFVKSGYDLMKSTVFLISRNQMRWRP